MHPDNRKSFRKQWYQMRLLRRWILHKTREHGMFVLWVRELPQAVSWVLQKHCVESCSHGSSRKVCTEACLYFFQTILTLYLHNHSSCLIRQTTINCAEGFLSSIRLVMYIKLFTTNEEEFVFAFLSFHCSAFAPQTHCLYCLFLLL